MGGDRHLANINELMSSTDDLTVSMLAARDASGEWSRQSRALSADLTVEKRIQGKLASVVKSTGAYMAYRYLRTIGDVGVAMGRMSFDTIDAERAISNLSLSQKLFSVILIKHLRITQWAARATDVLSESAGVLGTNTTRLLLGFTRLIVNIVTIMSVFLALGLIVGAISIAMSGMDSFVIDLTRDLGPLTDAVDGLVMALSGEGTGSIFDVFLGALITFGVIAAVTSVPVGVLAGSLMFMAGVFHLVQDALTPLLGEVGGTAAAFAIAGASLGPFLVILTKIPILGGFVTTALNTLIVSMGGFVSATSAVLLKAFGAIGAGFALMLFAATNDLKGFKGFVVSTLAAITGAVLMYSGLMMLGIASSVAFPVVAIMGLIALLYKYRDTVKEIWEDIKGFFGGGLGSEPEGVPRTPDMYGYGTSGSTHPRSRAIGGPVSRGRPYLVGEKGPELFTPSESGDITTNEKLSGNNTVNHINIKLDVSGVTDRSDKRALAREISDMLNQEVRRLGGQPTRGRF
tara:strand:+ start:740 stop:2290 length:1551 start_codon:yes stop_codon:yes gene_type:complete